MLKYFISVLIVIFIIFSSYLLSEKIKTIENEKIEEICKEEIAKAMEYSKQREVCTQIVMELVCPFTNSTYLITNGCAIEYLINKGWKEIS